jgi:hypothetical protein
MPALPMSATAHADRAHRYVERAIRQMMDDAPFAECDVGRGLIVGEHREHDPPCASVSEMISILRTELDELCTSSGAAIEYRDLMPSPDEIGSHCSAHAAKSDEFNFHR